MTSTASGTALNDAPATVTRKMVVVLDVEVPVGADLNDFDDMAGVPSNLVMFVDSRLVDRDPVGDDDLYAIRDVQLFSPKGLLLDMAEQEPASNAFAVYLEAINDGTGVAVTKV